MSSDISSASTSGGIRFIAIVLSLLLHALLLITYGGSPMGAAEQPEDSVVRLSFLAPEPEPVAEQIPEPEPVAEPEPEPEPEIVEKVIPQHIVEPVQEVMPEPAVEPQHAVVMQTAVVATPQVDEGMIKRQTDRYLSSVLAHIEQYKWYPGLARRRGIEGDVTVRFLLHHDGSIQDLMIENGPSLLNAAAQRTVEKAMPMPMPPAQIDCPLECKFKLSFHLDRS